MNKIGSKKKDVSIVIPSKNEEKNIGKCLDIIYKQDTSYSFEVIVIDSGSKDRTIDIVKEFSKVKMIKIKPEAFAHGKTRNLGAQISKGDFIIYLNADALPVNKNWLNPLIDEMKKDMNIAGTFSRHIPKENCYLYMVRDLLKSMPAKRIEKGRAKKFDYMLFSTVSSAIRREIWEQYHFKDKIIIAEDQDWAKRILSKGLKIIYEPNSIVYHSHNYSLKELFEIKFNVGQSYNRFNNKFSAMFIGFFLMIGGVIIKVFGDFWFIVTKRISFYKKIKEIKISLFSRIVSFLGRYMGWINS